MPGLRVSIGCMATRLYRNNVPGRHAATTPLRCMRGLAKGGKLAGRMDCPGRPGGRGAGVLLLVCAS